MSSAPIAGVRPAVASLTHVTVGSHWGRGGVRGGGMAVLEGRLGVYSFKLMYPEPCMMKVLNCLGLHLCYQVVPVLGGGKLEEELKVG